MTGALQQGTQMMQQAAIMRQSWPCSCIANGLMAVLVLEAFRYQLKRTIVIETPHKSSRLICLISLQPPHHIRIGAK